jgi:hypothetical protein
MAVLGTLRFGNTARTLAVVAALATGTSGCASDVITSFCGPAPPAGSSSQRQWEQCELQTSLAMAGLLVLAVGAVLVAANSGRGGGGGGD